MWKDSIRNIVVTFQTNILRIVGFYVRHSAMVHAALRAAWQLYCDNICTAKASLRPKPRSKNLHGIKSQIFSCTQYSSRNISYQNIWTTFISNLKGRFAKGQKISKGTYLTLLQKIKANLFAILTLTLHPGSILRTSMCLF